MSSEQRIPRTPKRENKVGAKKNWYNAKKEGGKKDKCKAQLSQNKKMKSYKWVAHKYGDDFMPHSEEESPTANIPQHDRNMFSILDGNGLATMRQTLKELANHAGAKHVDEIISHIEGIGALLVTLQGCRDYVSMSTALFLYIRNFTDKSLTSIIMDYISNLFEVEPHSSDSKPLCESMDWISLMRNLRDNWELVKVNKFFSHFSKLLGLIVTLELCKVSDVTFEFKGFQYCAPDMEVVHGNALDIMDAMLSTVTYFVETLSLCWRTKSAYPLLVNNQSACELDEEYAKIVMWWDLVKNGNLERVQGISEHEFDRRLEALTTKISGMIGNSRGFDRKLIQDKFMRLLQIKNDYVTMKISSGIRKSPYCIELFGASSQGKSTYGEQIITALLTSAGLPVDKEYRASYNAGDRYMSNWTSNKLVMTIDDMANDKSKFVEKPPTRAIIDICNNQPYYANMADLASKGKVFVEPEICLVTTNKKDLDARVYSNCPYSIQRRMHAVITVKAKPEFQYMVDGRPQGVDARKVEAFKKTNPDAWFDDIWLLTVEKAVQPEKLEVEASYKPIEYQGKSMVDVSFKDVLQYLIAEFHAHRSAQQSLVDSMRKREIACVCGIDGCVQIKGWCDKHPIVCQPVTDLKKQGGYEKQFGDGIVDSIQRAGTIVHSRISRDLFGLDTAVEGLATTAILASATRFARFWDWMWIVPGDVVENNKFQNFMMWMNKDKLKRSYIRHTCLLWSSVFGISCLVGRNSPRSLPLVAPLVGSALVAQKNMVGQVKREFRKELQDRNTIAPLMKEWRDSHVRKICSACAIVGAMYGIAKVYKAWRRMRPQGSLEPKTIEEVEQRDSEVNQWTSVTLRDLPMDRESKTTSVLQLENLVAKNLVYGSVTIDDRVLMVNGLYITSNVVIIPNHYFEKESIDVTFRKRNPEKAGGKFAVRLSVTQSVLLKHSDLRVCYSSSGGSFKDLRKYLSNKPLDNVHFLMQYRNQNGTMALSDGIAKHQPISNGVVSCDGYYYNNLSVNTYRGMCGAVMTSKMRPIILGLHIGGKAGTPRGCANMLLRSEIEDAIDELREKEAVVISGSAEQFEAQVLGVNVIKRCEPHHKSPLRYMPHDSQVEYYGTCPGMSTFRSNVKVTLMSEHVTEVTGDPNVYGPPVINPQYYGWQTCLANLAVPAHPYEADLLNAAVRDYKSDLIPIFESKLWNACKPLSEQENMLGLAGKKFVDAIPLNTSIGYPLNGPKRNHVIETLDDAGNILSRKFTDEIIQEIDRCEKCYERGERAFTIAKACKKDEILSKKKCRIFYGNPIALTFLVRKYFLPLVRVLQFNPKVSECAVGINSHGPEWQELHEHIHHFGDDRLIGGDYGKYDQKLPSQLIFAALRILMDCARVCNYSKENLRVMEAMTGDLVYAIIAYNGDLIGLSEGTHISGNSLTVILNGICGSLNLRAYFYKENPFEEFDRRLKFREYVKLVTYGDDNIGSVSPEIQNFTIAGASKFLASYGQTYTMPDKESELLDFLPKEEFEFLKRKSIFIPEIGVHVGALIDKSCLKMLHCYLRDKKSPLTEQQACAQNIDTALREWFNHGRSVYEHRRKQMKEIASRTGIDHLCTLLDETFDDRVIEWKCKYKGEKMEAHLVDIVDDL